MFKNLFQILNLLCILFSTIVVAGGASEERKSSRFSLTLPYSTARANPLLKQSLGLTQRTFQGPDLPPFYRIYCTDQLTIHLSHTPAAPSLHVVYQPENQGLIPEVLNGTLNLSMQKQQEDLPASNRPMVISLNSGPLKEIIADGNCKIETSDVESYGLELIAMGNGQVIVKGNNVHVNKIIAQHQSFVEVLWANTSRLYLNAFNDSEVKIAGTAKETFLRAYGHSKIDAQYLRTQHINVFAKNFGFIQVLPLCELRAFSEGYARIDYFTVPRNAMLVTQLSGNVLWMGYRK